MKGSASTYESFTHPNTRSFSGHSVFPACFSKKTVNYRDDRILVWYAATPSSHSHISEPRHLATKRFFAPFRWWSRSMSNSTTLMDFLSAQVGLLAANLELTAFCCFCIISRAFRGQAVVEPTSATVAWQRFGTMTTTWDVLINFKVPELPAVPIPNWAFWQTASQAHIRPTAHGDPSNNCQLIFFRSTRSGLKKVWRGRHSHETAGALQEWRLRGPDQ